MARQGVAVTARSKLRVVHEDRDLLVIDKPPGLLTVATERERERTAYYLATDHVRRGAPKSPKRVFVVHRLDRETSGVLIFAKNPEAKQRLQGQWTEVRKTYLAVVHGKMRQSAGTITASLAENRAGVVYVPRDSNSGLPARTDYRVLCQNGNRALLEVTPLTGRKHQIRVHLSHARHPIIGDRKYGGKDGATRLALHALSITFKHPYDRHLLTLEAKPSGNFARLVQSIGGDWIGAPRGKWTKAVL